MIAFGPIPSRRLGYSIGINHILPKHCSYSCIYCQVGWTDHLQISQGEFFSVEEILQSVKQKIEDAQRQGQAIDYLSFVPDGEPTLDIHLGEEIEALKRFGYPIAVISNSTLIDQPRVRQALSKADWVSVKVDSVIKEKWRKVNRPYKPLNLDTMLNGILKFVQDFSGSLVTETMLVSGVNDDAESIDRLVEYLSKLKPTATYLSIPIRPAAEAHVSPPDSVTLNQIFRKISAAIPSTYCLFDAETEKFVATGDLREDILSITAVHPLREAALRKMVTEAKGHWDVVEELIYEKKIQSLDYRGQKFYKRTRGDH